MCATLTFERKEPNSRGALKLKRAAGLEAPLIFNPTGRSETWSETGATRML